MAFSTSRIFTSRRRPPRLAGGIIGSINAHSPSVRSLVIRRPLRAANRRCSAIHIWCLSQSLAPYIESQPIPLTQQLSGSALILLQRFLYAVKPQRLHLRFPHVLTG